MRTKSVLFGSWKLKLEAASWKMLGLSPAEAEPTCHFFDHASVSRVVLGPSSVGVVGVPLG